MGGSKPEVDNAGQSDPKVTRVNLESRGRHHRIDPQSDYRCYKRKGN